MAGWRRTFDRFNTFEGKVIDSVGSGYSPNQANIVDPSRWPQGALTADRAAWLLNHSFAVDRGQGLGRSPGPIVGMVKIWPMGDSVDHGHSYSGWSEYQGLCACGIHYRLTSGRGVFDHFMVEKEGPCDDSCKGAREVDPDSLGAKTQREIGHLRPVPEGMDLWVEGEYYMPQRGYMKTSNLFRSGKLVPPAYFRDGKLQPASTD